MAIDVNGFVTSFNSRPPLKTSHFDVTISWGERTQDFRFRVDSTEMPGRAVVPIEHSHYGPPQKIAGGTGYADLTMSVILSEDYSEAEYFYDWMEHATGRHRVSGSRPVGLATASGFNVKYFKTYAGLVNINGYDTKGKRRRTVTLQEAYPILVSPINYSWGSGDIGRINVTMTYRYWTDQVFTEDEVEVGLGEAPPPYDGAATVNQRTQEGSDRIRQLIASGAVQGVGPNNPQGVRVELLPGDYDAG